MQRVTITLDDALMEELDAIIAARGYQNRSEAIRDLARRFEHRLFLSATPHNGHSNSFSALLELLDDQRFTRGVKVLKSNLEGVMVRRLKEDLRQIGGFWRRFWFNDMPSHLTPERLHGGIIS